MSAGDTFSSDWLHTLYGAAPSAGLWAAWQADGHRYGEACEAAFRGLYAQLDAAERGIEGLSQATGPQGEGDGEADASAGLPPWLEALGRLGPWQEALGRSQAAYGALQRFNAAYGACAALLVGAAREGLRELEQRLADPERASPQPSAGPQSSRELYGQWLETNEAAYEAVLASPEWARAFGRLANAATELAGHWQAEADAALRRLDLPSRADLVDTLERVDRLERSVEGGAATEAAGLRAEVARLREEVAALREEVAGADARQGGR